MFPSALRNHGGRDIVQPAESIPIKSTPLLHPKYVSAVQLSTGLRSRESNQTGFLLSNGFVITVIIIQLVRLRFSYQSNSVLLTIRENCEYRRLADDQEIAVSDSVASFTSNYREQLG